MTPIVPRSRCRPIRRRAAAGLAALTLVLPLPSFALMQDYLPLTDQELTKGFPVRHLGTVGPEGLSGLDAGVGSVRVASDEETGMIELSGADRAGKTWRVRLGDRMHEAFVADVDANGTTDLLLVMDTMGNGLAPTTHLTALLFDETGGPVPFTAEGFMEYGDQGLSDLLDLDGDGRAELVYMTHDEGYWITHLYTAKAAHWQRVAGAFAGHTWPLHTRFTTQANRKAVTPKAGKHPYAADLSNLSPVAKGRLGVQWAEVSTSEDITLRILPPKGHEAVCRPSSWQSTLSAVLDEPEGRRIASLNDEEGLHALLDEVAAKGHPVQAFGQRTRGQCSPELLWATPAP